MCDSEVSSHIPNILYHYDSWACARSLQTPLGIREVKAKRKVYGLYGTSKMFRSSDCTNIPSRPCSNQTTFLQQGVNHPQLCAIPVTATSKAVREMMESVSRSLLAHRTFAASVGRFVGGLEELWDVYDVFSFSKDVSCP